MGVNLMHWSLALMNLGFVVPPGEFTGHVLSDNLPDLFVAVSLAYREVCPAVEGELLPLDMPGLLLCKGLEGYPKILIRKTSWLLRGGELATSRASPR